MNFLRPTKIKLVIFIGLVLAIGSLWLIPGPVREGAEVRVEFEEQVQQGQRRQARVVVNSNVPVNALDIEVVYPTDLLEVEDVSRDSSDFDTVVFEPSVDSEAGKVRYAQASLTPVVGDGVVGTIDFKAKKPGFPTFAVEGKVIKHDGEGTDVLVRSHNRSVGEWVSDEIAQLIVDR